MRARAASGVGRAALAAASSIFCIAPPKSLSGPAQRAEWMPGSPPSASTARPESSAKAGSPRACAAACALMRALARKVVPVSSGSGKAKLAGRHRFDAVGREQFAHLAQLAGIMRGDDEPAGDAAAHAVRCGSHHRHLLQVDELADAFARQRQQREQLLLA